MKKMQTTRKAIVAGAVGGGVANAFVEPGYNVVDGPLDTQLAVKEVRKGRAPVPGRRLRKG
jgi:hypothetical protein